jgi:hypothetical protein
MNLQWLGIRAFSVLASGDVDFPPENKNADRGQGRIGANDDCSISTYAAALARRKRIFGFSSLFDRRLAGLL